MMALEYTADQQAAICSRGRQLIVSAAAGSGKTAVLVDRVVGLLCDAENPVDIDRLLVVTFTNAAAAEMRGRIADALAGLLARRPGDRRLRRQLALLGEARIQTVHAFCQSLLRRNFQLAGLSPDFTLLDTVESERLMAQAMETLLEAEYQADTSAFRALRDTLCEERGDRRLERGIRMVYDKLRSHPEPGSWLAYMAARLPQSPELTDWGKGTLRRAKATMDYQIEKLTNARVELLEEKGLNDKYGNAFDYCLDQGARITAALATDWDSASKALSAFEKPAFGRAPTGTDPAFKARMQAARDIFCDAVEALQEGPLGLPAAGIMEQEALAQPLITELCRLVEGFSSAYDSLKAEQEALDFSDLEHRALALLRTPQGDATPLAQELAAELCEVLVDEYQDTNSIQERLFQSLIPPGGSAFFVGDVKQSIYRFRLADPSIFLDRLESSPPLEAEPLGRARVALRRNFRSQPAVIQVCNHVFDRVMSRQLGDVDYDHFQRLEAGLMGEGGCELILMEADGLRDEDEDSEEKAVLEARLAAGRIAHMLSHQRVLQGDGSWRPAQPGDFAILLSSFASKAPAFSRELLAAGIPVNTVGEDDFFGAIEISILISLLRVIDNRRQDIPLIAVLRSPLFSFSADDLARVRLSAPGQDFCTALEAAALEAAAQGGDSKCLQFLARLDAFSQAAQDMGVAQLLRYLYRETGAQGAFAALEDGQARLLRLEALWEAAQAFEAGGSRGLYRFLVHLDGRMAAAQPPTVATAGAGVQLMSIHKSKGLEFPFVVLPDLSKPFNTDDSRGSVLFHQSLGLGFTLREPALRIEYPTAAHSAIAAAIGEEGLSEELRKLYVAMTRARQRLILIMSVRNAPRHLSAWAEAAGERVAPQFLKGCRSATPWLCTALLTHPGAAPLRALCDRPPPVEAGDPGALVCSVIHWQDVPQPGRAMMDGGPDGEARIGFEGELALLGREYPHLVASALPSKLTPTGVKRYVEDAGEIDGEPGRAQARMYRRYESESPLSAAGRGTALHIYLRHMDYRACGGVEAARADILRVCMAGLLETQEAKAIDPAAVAALAASPLGQRVRGAPEVLREYQFSALFTPHELLQNGLEDEHILLNGAIDLLLLGPEGLEVVDFKSDAISPGFEASQAQKHRLQLELYGLAAGRIFGRPVVAKTVYFLKTGGEARL